MKVFYIFVILFICFTLKSEVKLPSIFSDHMVLQQKEKVKIWGWAKPLEKITVTTSWDNGAYVDTTDSYANWDVNINTPSFGGPYTITIQGYNKVILEDVMLGEVWLASGQSNMEWSVNASIQNGEVEAKNANYPNIRFIKVWQQTARQPQNNFEGQWEICSPQSVSYNSAVAYFFARKLNQELNIPIGIINSSWGGTPAEAWTPEESINKDGYLLHDAILLKEVPWGPVKTASIYNAMIAPFTKFKIKGALWYQGESNVMNFGNYDRLLSTMVSAWREKFDTSFPFYFAQIAPYKYGSPGEGAGLRNAQRKAQEIIPNSNMIVLTDIGDTSDIHPKNKLDVGLRFANLALTNQYDKKNLNTSGPTYLSHLIKDDKIRLIFKTNGKLKCDAKCKQAFELIDAEENIVKAEIEIEDTSIILSSKLMKNPVKARFSWSNTATEILSDDTFLPCSTFLTKD